MNESIRRMLVPVLFFVAAAFWAAVVATGGGYLLFWAGLLSLGSGVAVLAAPSRWFTRPLSLSTSLFALSLTLYQLVIASSLIGSRFAAVGVYSFAAFGAVTAVYLVVLFSLLSLKPAA